jgi:DNA-binding transcriptional LysR family regulator
VIETGSLTIAAGRLRLSQPAVTKAVQQVEEQLAFPLFLRERGRLVPTADARILLPEIIRASASLEAVNRLAEDLRELRTGVVTLAATPVLGNSLAAAAIAGFHAAHPGVSVVLETMPNHEVVTAVADHLVDFGLALAPVEHGHVIARDLCSSNLVCVMPDSHPLTALKFVTVGDLASHPLISFDRQQPLGTLVEGAFEAAGARRSVGIQVTQSWTACALVQAGAGIAVIDGFSLLPTTWPCLSVRPFQPRVPIVGRLLLPQDRQISRHAEILIQTLREVIGDQIKKRRRSAELPAE